jgi:Cu+-exporting ATPase
MGKEDMQPETTNVYLFIGDRVKGYFRIENSYRRGLDEVISNLKGKYDLSLLSGDNDAEKKNLEPLFGKDSRLLFNQSPTDKMAFINELRKHNKHVLMIGDGLNDAGALMKSQVGLTIADDIYSFSPACDGIIESTRFSKLYDFIRFTNISMNVVKISFVISFLYNIVGIFFAVQGTLSPLIAAILMPISSISVVVFATFAISFMAHRTFLHRQ